MRSQNQLISVRWASWTPFEEGPLSDKEISLELNEDAQVFPSHQLVFSNAVVKASLIVRTTVCNNLCNHLL